MYTREYLIALFFPAQRPYWFVSVLPRNPIPFPYPYFPNPIPFPPKNIETVVEMRFFHPFSSLRPTELANASTIMLTATKQARDALYRRINESIMHLCMQAWRRFISGLTWICWRKPGFDSRGSIMLVTVILHLRIVRKSQCAGVTVIRYL